MKLQFSIFVIRLLVLQYVASSTALEIRNLRCSSTNVENYSCTWEIGANDDPNYYDVSYEDSYSQAQICPKLKPLVQDDKRLTCKFHKDARGSVHCQTIEVRAISSKSRLSKEISFCPRKETLANPPVAIQFPSITSTSIKVKWQKPNDVINYESRLLYRLEYRKGNTDQVWKKPPNTSEIKEKTCWLTSLEGYTDYEIRMASKIESAEWGPWSPVSTAATLPGIPGIVSNMSAVSESNSLSLEWTIPSEPNGPIDYYTIRSRFQERGWFYQNTTNTRIVIPIDCYNVTEGTALTTNVAAVNIVNSSKLRGEWAQRDYPVCDLQDIVTILPTALQNIDKIKVVNITLMVIIVPSVIVLFMIIGRFVIKRYSKLDLSGSPNLSRRYQLKRVCPPAIEEEKFDELRTYAEQREKSVKVEKLSACSCEKLYNSHDSDALYAGVACHTKLAVSPRLDLPTDEVEMEAETTDLLKSTAWAGDSSLKNPSSLSNAEYVCKGTPNVDTTCRPVVSSLPTGDLEAYIPHNFIPGHKLNNTRPVQETASYLPHNTCFQTVKNVEKPLSTERENEDAEKFGCRPTVESQYIPHYAVETVLHSEFND